MTAATAARSKQYQVVDGKRLACHERNPLERRPRRAAVAT